MRNIGLVILPCSQLYNGSANEDTIKEQMVQLSKKRSYRDLKSRIIDCLKAQGYKNLDANKVRLWNYSGNKEDFVEMC